MVTVDVKNDKGHGTTNTNNKKPYIKNVIEWFLISGRVATGCNNLKFQRRKTGGSQDEVDERKNSKDRNEVYEVNKKTIKLSYSVKGTDVKFEKEIEIIDDILEFNMFEWFDNFEKISRKNGWNSDQNQEILRDLIIDKRLDDKMFNGDLAKIREKILIKTYNPDRVDSWMTKLENVKQEDFTFIDDYYDFIKEHVLWYGIAYKASKEEMNRKTWEYFRRNLGIKTRKKLIETLDVHDLDSYLKKLRIMEKEIMKLVNAESGSRSVDRDESNRNSHGESKKDKWCKHHKFYGHHTKDCIFEKKSNEERMTVAYEFKETEIKESRESDDSSDLNEMIVERLSVIREAEENNVSLKTSSDEKYEWEMNVVNNRLERLNMLKVVEVKESEYKKLYVKNKSRLERGKSLRDYVKPFREQVDEKIYQNKSIGRLKRRIRMNYRLKKYYYLLGIKSKIKSFRYGFRSLFTLGFQF